MASGPEDFDHRWLTTLTAKHRVVFDAHVLGEAVPLVRANNFLNAAVTPTATSRARRRS
ncbi:MAG: hypothetical protein IPJ11_16405 [Gemmatimonadetes bacterium]|nr:hypothetical protein [Gemmatimonadota bacterium]